MMKRLKGDVRGGRSDGSMKNLGHIFAIFLYLPGPCLEYIKMLFGERVQAAHDKELGHFEFMSDSLRAKAKLILWMH